jgi:hypothetical protein
VVGIIGINAFKEKWAGLFAILFARVVAIQNRIEIKWRHQNFSLKLLNPNYRIATLPGISSRITGIEYL